MIKTALIYGDSPGIKNTASAIQEYLSSKGCKVIFKPADEITIPEITASEILIFGHEGVKKDLKDGPFQEINRIFNGINLAGRLALLFTTSEGKTEQSIKSLIALLNETSIEIYEDQLLFDEDGDGSSVTYWLDEALSFYKRMKNERNQSRSID